MITFALFGTFLLSGEAKAQSYLPIETQVYLDLTRLCMQRGDAQCAAAALTKAVQSYPPLAQSPQVVSLLRTLKARAGSNGAANPGGYNPGFNIQRNQPRPQPNYEEYNRCMENARPMSGVNRMLKLRDPQSGFQLDQTINKQGKVATLAWPIGRVMAELFDKLGWMNRNCVYRNVNLMRPLNNRG